MAGFGKGTDYFDLPTVLANSGLKYIETSTTPAPVSVEYAQDEDGITVASGSYDGGPATAIQCTYDLLSGSLDLTGITLGFITASNPKVAITGIEVTTSNSAWPRLVVSGFTGITNETTMPSFACVGGTIQALRQAQGLDFTVGANCRLTSSKLSVSCDFHHALDEDGSVAAMALTGCRAEISGDAVEIEGVVAWTPDGSYTETQAPGAGNSNIGFGTASFSAEKFIAAA